MMNDSPYQELDKLIDEYEQVEHVFRPDSLLILSYPKILVMSIASLFEVRIKSNITDFYNSPISSLQSNYPLIYSLSPTAHKTVADLIYGKFYTTDRAGNENLSAQEFYNLFGGQAFKADLQNIFQSELNSNLTRITNQIHNLSPLVEPGNKYEADFASYTDKKEQLEHCSFEVSERAFLSLKLRRNRVAHDYINGLSDTFVDIRNFYYDAVLYVIALETTLISLTVFPQEDSSGT